jgi:hypothetical protein
MLSAHVDDQLIACNNHSALDKYKRQLNTQFECSDSGPAGYFPGSNIYRDRAAQNLYISQKYYFQSVLERFDQFPTCSGHRRGTWTG